MKPIHERSSHGSSLARILVCDDAPTVRGMMAQILGRTYTLQLTASAEEALERAPAFSPDLVITDLLLPGMSGRELVKRLRAIPAFEDVPMILLTAVGESDARADGLEAGADDYIVKPIRERELRARVLSLLRLRKTLLALSLRSRELEEANAALRAAQDRLLRSERLAALGSLAAALAHDINNPLSLVASGSSALLTISQDAMRHAGPIDGDRFLTLMDEVHTVAGEVLDGSRRLQAIGRDLRLFGAGDAAAATPILAEDAVRTAISLASAAAVDSQTPTITIQVASSPQIDAPEHLVALALLSILHRAVHSAGPGGHVRVDVHDRGHSVEIAIRDDGAPIPVALLPSVFQPFTSPGSSAASSGLGLAVAAGIVQGLGGHIDVDGSMRAGACFRVSLPIARTPPSES